MNKSIILLVAVLLFGILAADAAWRQPASAYAAIQTAGDEADRPKDNQGAGNGHLGHH
jgi:hypothetical protein